MIEYLKKEEEFNTYLEKEKVLVDFFAEWCGPCKMMGKVLEESNLSIPVVKINTDEFPELARKYGVMSIPTLILLENGVEKLKHIGFMSKEELEEFIK